MEKTKQAVDLWIREHECPKTIRYGLALRENGELIGMIGVVGYFDDAPEISFCLCRRYWNRGYMTEACMVMLDYLSAIGCQTVIAEVGEDNAAGNRVIQKCGFAFEKKETRICPEPKPNSIVVKRYRKVSD